MLYRDLALPSRPERLDGQGFSNGFAYEMDENGAQGLLKHKKLLLTTATMGSEQIYKQSGVADAMRTLDQFCWGFVGIRDVKDMFLYEAATDPEARKKHLESAYIAGKEF